MDPNFLLFTAEMPPHVQICVRWGIATTNLSPATKSIYYYNILKCCVNLKNIFLQKRLTTIFLAKIELQQKSSTVSTKIIKDYNKTPCVYGNEKSG